MTRQKEIEKILKPILEFKLRDKFYKAFIDASVYGQGEINCSEEVDEILSKINSNKLEWVSVKERLPNEYNKEYIAVLVIDSGIIFSAYYVLGRFIPNHQCEISSFEFVTHWMPLPPAPEIIDA